MPLALAALADDLILRQAPYRLLRDAVTLAALAARLCHACDHMRVDWPRMLTVARRLWCEGPSHPNRDVRERTLELLALLAPHAAILCSDEFCELVGRLATLLGSERQQNLALAAGGILCTLCKSPETRDACRTSGLPAVLLALPAHSRQGELGRKVSEMQLLLGALGAPSALGASLAGALLGEHLYTDAEMVWPDCEVRLAMHTALLELRAPGWARMLHRHPAGSWHVARNDGYDASLTPEACCCLYRLVVSGQTTLGGLAPKALVAAAKVLDARHLLAQPACDATGISLLSRHLARAADVELACADVLFELCDGSVLPAHRCLLAASSEYFRTALQWGRHSQSTAQPERIRVERCCEAPFRALLRFIYSGVSGLGEGSAPPLTATEALELSLTARRYLLPVLSGAALDEMRQALRPVDVAPLLLVSHREGADDVAALITEWAVAHYADVADAIELWIGPGGCTTAAPPPVRELGVHKLRLLLEELRVVMLRSKFGLESSVRS